MSGTHSPLPKKHSLEGCKCMQMSPNNQPPRPFGWGRRISPPTGCLSWKQSHRREAKRKVGDSLGLLNISFTRCEFSWAHILKGCSEADALALPNPRNNSQTSWAEGWLSCLCWMLSWKEGFGPGESSTFNVDTRAEQSKKISDYFNSSWAGVYGNPVMGIKQWGHSCGCEAFIFLLFLLVDLGEKKWE